MLFCDDPLLDFEGPELLSGLVVMADEGMLMDKGYQSNVTRVAFRGSLRFVLERATMTVTHLVSALM